MSQRDVLDEMCKNKSKWFTTNEICDIIGILSKESITNSLKRLIHSGDVEYKIDVNAKHGYLYRLKQCKK